MPLNQHLKLSTREFHTPPHFNLGKTTVGAHSHEWRGESEQQISHYFLQLKKY